VDLRQVLHDIELQYRPLAQAKGLDFRIHAAPGSVMSDGILLRRIVGNLVSNAIKYTQRGGVLLAARNRGSDGDLGARVARSDALDHDLAPDFIIQNTDSVARGTERLLDVVRGQHAPVWL